MVTYLNKTDSVERLLRQDEPTSQPQMTDERAERTVENVMPAAIGVLRFCTITGEIPDGFKRHHNSHYKRIELI